MNGRFERLKAKLMELFQLDQPDLDFGIYRILHARSAEVTQFLEHDLLPQVKGALATYQSADKTAIQKELDETIAKAHELGADPDGLPKVQELRARLATEAVDVEALEAEVYDHLQSFFNRYYHEGDFISLRRYKEGVYAIPYEGEEVKLYWANHDQYYIKTGEYLRDYSFRLRPDDEADPMRVHFRVVDAAEGEHGNVKEAEGKKREFILAGGEFMSEEMGEAGPRELVIRFEYRPPTLEDWPAEERDGKDKPPSRDQLLGVAECRILEFADIAFATWVRALAAPHLKADGTTADYSRLRAHLNRYTARNTFDYFIHKDLGGFLRRELDFYIKNEVVHLDDIESETAPRVEQYLSKVKIIRRIAHKIIDFLAQIEDFQKKLWLKKKFVTETSWCLSIATMLEIEDAAAREALLAEVAVNEGQREEWVTLHGIDALPEADAGQTTPSLFDTGAAAYSVPLTVPFVTAHPTLMVDTRHFSPDFTARLLDAIEGLDEKTDGVLFHSENFQALSLMQARYREQVKCIYIDPPYNTGNDGFVYKDRYQHSSWAQMLFDRCLAARHLLHASDGSFFSSIDDGEICLLRQELAGVFGAENFVGDVIWQKKYAPANDAKWFSDDHDFLLLFARSKLDWSPGRLARDAKQNRAYSNPDNDLRGPWMSDNYKCNKTADQRPNLYYSIVQPNTGEEIWPKRNRVWAYSRDQHERNLAENRVWWGRDGCNSEPRYKRFLGDVGGLVPRTIWTYQEVGHNQDGIRELRDLLPETPFTGPKPVRLIQRVASVGRGTRTLDFFAGSGTTGHAVINLNREDGGCRKFILVEMADYFDTVLLPRLKKVTFSPEWKEGRPKRLATDEEAKRSPRIFKIVRLESYEDTLNNLELRRSDSHPSLLTDPAAQVADGLAEQYVLRYMLDVESRGSASLLNVDAFSDPTGYVLRAKRSGSDESRDVCVDLLETFNWLLGLRVEHIEAPQRFTATFDRDAEGRLRLAGGGLRSDSRGPYWFRSVVGTTPEDGRTLVIWRTCPGGDSAEAAEQNNLVLDEWFTRQRYSTRDPEFDFIFVNGDNNLENLKAVDEESTARARWKVRLIEEDFFRLMFEGEGA